MNHGDLKALQAPLLVLVVAAFVAAAAVYYTDILLQEARQQLTRQQAQLREADTRLHKSGEEKEIIASYLGRYQQLQRIGFIGEEQRINWLDGLRLANQQMDLFGIDYQISAQRPYPYAAELSPGRLALHQSVMKLRFRLLHEEDLMRFFSALSGMGAGLFLIDECTLKRTQASAAIGYQPNLTADCELSWITAQPVGAEKKP
ncbi:MAG: hypothetical protein A3G24_21565 [Betaproteobacteria bacterium RIFCSPLOWO2_12_FULL_62_13]|nr:MAG: hypothetical protein A3G24_21565 [Betaproteobacteria bacterium RIFCSPLOWO2_12_FULL_62_13]